jgi:hypothetical protein
MTHQKAAGTAEAVEARVERVGPIAVRTDSAAVRDFQGASGGDVLPGLVPLIFPICWLALPEVRAGLLEGTGGRDIVPVHESQSFTTRHRLELDRDYLLAVALRRSSQPERLTLQGTVTTPDGDLCVEFETVLRLIGLYGRGVGASAGQTETSVPAVEIRGDQR